LAEEPELNLHPVYLDLPKWARWWKRGQRGVRLYYILWQWRARRIARALHAEHRFDVAHHITFARWIRCRQASLASAVFRRCGVRLEAQLRSRGPLMRWLGASGLLEEVDVKVFAASAHARHDTRASDKPIAVFAGRLVRWKGIRLAIAVLAEPAASTWNLRVFGDGYDRVGAEKFARSIGVDDRVTFEGLLPRAKVTEALQTADLFLFPSMHDSAPWAVAEAITMRVPVVCLDRCGPGEFIRRTAGGTAVAPNGDAARSLAASLRTAPAVTADAVSFLSADRLGPLLDGWYSGATT
jgi:glycosyltransferase involved in cell wall biosynthesis